MKKFLILLLSITLFTACSDDDSDTNDGTEIVGKWFLESLRPVGGDNTLNSCNQDSYIEFNSDGTGSSEFFEETETGCESEGVDSGNWSYNGGNSYTIVVPNFGSTTGNVNFTGDNQFIFTSPELPGVEVVFVK
ncbi:lipocalin family protein [Christiangramia sediminis]|uniref:Lipocalin family protein n=1 Tax=Christiangramia sediminis TaxID=2881336 RepID=A0A9X1LI81_9FLAO|nr:lipocalin family protein [Christiangramia sediminis]MCB7480792.1 lipocalin family protein [Christiangramia sediminis]